MALLSEQRKQILTEKRVELVGMIQPHELWAHLRYHGIVTEQDEARIQLNKTSFEQVNALLDHIAKGTAHDYRKFCKCLKANNQGHIVTEILQSETSKELKSETWDLNCEPQGPKAFVDTDGSLKIYKI
ncbi:hypothetical protein CAPTEDRAFT_202174 [Capitella teleta]|uniref:CARD domain-containing protein n=1 Tax=Capitella teleta TaxID=283909 RepID=R7U3N9_CAPTE|nr:hypothetical protein CAPTEDRAFT_202174 [Capitella teleta]|eukprot:ELU00925.1 hypothetical protein CAPTEDRAFT_202174 [Capitella teleta]